MGSAHPDPFGKVGSSIEGLYPGFRASQHRNDGASPSHLGLPSLQRGFCSGFQS